MSASFIQFNSAQLLPIITHLILQVFRSGIVPPTWKSSYLQPIPKKGSLSTLSNYRGIAISSCIPKIFDRLLTKRLQQAGELIFNQHQHGFRKGRSTATNLFEVTQLIHDSFSNGHQVDIIYFDISRAFDKLNHRILAQKLARYGMPLQLFLVTMSFVINRKYILKLFNQPTNYIIEPFSAVPQGSCAGPVLYLYYSNDAFSTHQDVLISSYADDTKLIMPIKSQEDADTLQQAINQFALWAFTNKLEINIKKTSFVSFSKRARRFNTQYSCDGNNIIRSTTVRDLGILFDEGLCFRPHIEDIVHRSSAMLSVASRFANEARSPHIVLKIFNCHISPLLEYNSFIWDQRSVALTFLIERLKRQATRLTLRIPPSPIAPNYRSYMQRSLELSTITMEHRRQMLSICFCIKLLNGDMITHNRQLLLDALVRSRATRNPNIFNESSTIPTKSPLSIIMNITNTYSRFFQLDQSILTTKIKLKKHYLNTYAVDLN